MGYRLYKIRDRRSFLKKRPKAWTEESLLNEIKLISDRETC